MGEGIKDRDVRFPEPQGLSVSASKESFEDKIFDFKIYLVESDKTLLNFLRHMLFREGFKNVETFSDFNEFWTRLLSTEDKPDMLILSTGMGLINSLEVAKALKNTERTSDISIIILTSNVTAGFRKEAFEIGVDDVILKPISPDELIARIKMLLTRRYVTSLERKLLIERMRREEERKLREAYKDIIAAVTSGKLIIEDREGIDEVKRDAVLIHSCTIKKGEDIKLLRDALKDILSKRMDEDRLSDLLVSVGEISTNAIKHASGGTCKVFLRDDEVIVVIEDEGKGIDFSKLARSTLMPGYSTMRRSLGFGFTIAIELSDRIHLVSDKSGTSIAIRKRFESPDGEQYLEDLLERFDLDGFELESEDTREEGRGS